MNNRFACNHRVGARITDGQYYTLLNKASFYGMTVSDYIIKCCGLVDVPAQTEFKYYMINGEEISLDETPEAVQQGYMTLQEHYELEEEKDMHNRAEYLVEEVNKLYNSFDDPFGLFNDDDIEGIYYDECIRRIAEKHHQSGITYEMLKAHIATEGCSFIPPDGLRNKLEQIANKLRQANVKQAEE